MRRSGADRGHRAARGRAMGVSGFRAPFAAFGRPIDLFERPCRGEMWVVASSVIIHASAQPPPMRTPWCLGGVRA